MEKLQRCGYEMVKNLEDIFIRFGATHERDRQTDGHRVPAYTALMHMHRAVKYDKKIPKNNRLPNQYIHHI